MQSAFQLHVEDGNFHGTGLLIGREQGDVLVDYDWTAQPDTQLVTEFIG